MIFFFLCVSNTIKTCPLGQSDAPSGHISFVEICHEIMSTAILSLPLIQVGQITVTGERMGT